MAELSPEESALLQAISGPESRGSWNIIYGGGHFGDYSAHPRKYVEITSGPNKGKKSSAAGKYQITATTYDRVAPKLGISDFSPASQQQIALYLAREEYGPNLDQDLKDGKIAHVARKLSGVWTSLPGGIEATTSTKHVARNYNRALAAPIPPMNIPQVGTALDTIQQAFPRPMPSQIASAYAGQTKAPPPMPVPRPKNIDASGFNMAPPSLPLNTPLSPNRGASYGPNTGQWGPTVAQLGMQPFPSAAQTYQPGMAGRGLPPPMPIVAPTVQDFRREQDWARFVHQTPEALAIKEAENLRRSGSTSEGVASNILASIARHSVPSAPAAPVPMPGRPAALMAATPVQAQPPQLPAQRPSAPVAPPQQVQRLRLPSGDMIAPGVYDQGDHSVMVSDGGNGIAKIDRIRGPGAIPGVIDPLKEVNSNTVAGGMIRKMLPTALAGNASAFVPTVADNVKSAALGAASNLGNSIGGMFGGLFGGAKPPATWAPWGAIPALPQQRAPVRAPVPMSRPLSFFAQPQVAAPRVVVAPTPVQQSAAQRVNAFSDKPFGSPFW